MASMIDGSIHNRWSNLQLNLSNVISLSFLHVFVLLERSAIEYFLERGAVFNLKWLICIFLKISIEYFFDQNLNIVNNLSSMD